MDESRNQTVRNLIAQVRNGVPGAAGELMEAIYPDLKRLAAAKMRNERADHTWQPTALVHELYLQLLKSGALGGVAGDNNEKAAFFGLAGHMMMRLLIQHSRPLYRKVQKVPIAPEGAGPAELFAHDLDGVESILADLARIDPQLRAVVELKVFEGLSVEEIAARLGCSARTVDRRWNFARHWLATQLA